LCWMWVILIILHSVHPLVIDYFFPSI
jgi:hypothetical protein